MRGGTTSVFIIIKKYEGGTTSVFELIKKYERGGQNIFSLTKGIFNFNIIVHICLPSTMYLDFNI